jgi:hypothetical protein
MNSADYITVATFTNATPAEMRIYLEMVGDEVVLSPGHEIELLAKRSEGVLPVTVKYVDDGLQVYPHREANPDWHFRFRGRIYSAGSPNETRLADLS